MEINMFDKKNREIVLIISNEYNPDQELVAMKRILKAGGVPYSHSRNTRDIIDLSEAEGSKLFVSTITEMIKASKFDSAEVHNIKDEPLTFRMKRMIELASIYGLNVKFK